MKKIFACFLLSLLSLYAVTGCSASERPAQKKSPGSQNQVPRLTNVSPVDTAQYSVQVNGETNTVKINNQPVKTTKGLAGKQNTITINGEGNTVSVNKDTEKSKVNISQNGNNNHVTITQNSR